MAVFVAIPIDVWPLVEVDEWKRCEILIAGCGGHVLASVKHEVFLDCRELANQGAIAGASDLGRMEDLRARALDRLANREPIVFDVLRRRST
jgi:hypothetical protein